VGDLARLGRLEPCPVPLPGEPLRVVGGETGEQRHDRERYHHGHGVAADEPTQLVPALAAARRDRLPEQVELDVSGHAVCGRIPALGLLAECGHHDGVEITAKPPTEAVWAGPPGATGLTRPGGGIICRRLDRAATHGGRARRNRVVLTDSALHLASGALP